MPSCRSQDVRRDAYELSARRANRPMTEAHSEWAKIEFDRKQMWWPSWYGPSCTLPYGCQAGDVPRA